MKTQLAKSFCGGKRHTERGMAVIVVIVFISILIIYVGGNLRTLHLLRQDLKQVEQRQINRWKMSQVVTNASAMTNRLTAVGVVIR